MKNTKQDSMSAVSRFGRDKRNRVTNAEHIERSPRPRRDADNEGRSTFGRKDAAIVPLITPISRLIIA